VTNSTSRNNANEGLVAVRSSYLRVGQDRGGNAVPRPVTVNNNGTPGISVLDSSSANIVASNIHHNGSNGVLFQRGSAGTVGAGVNGLVSPNTIQNNTGTGVTVYQASAALVQGNTIDSNSRGVFVGTSSPRSSATASRTIPVAVSRSSKREARGSASTIRPTAPRGTRFRTTRATGSASSTVGRA